MVGTSGNILKFISPDSGQILHELQLPVDRLVYPEFTSDGSRLYVTAVEGDAWSVFVLETGPQEIEIDIKPGSYPNSINLKSKGVVAVAVLTTGDFIASEVDPNLLIFAEANPAKSSLEDVDLDGDDDLVLHFKIQEMALDENSFEAILSGQTIDGILFEGVDTVTIRN